MSRRGARELVLRALYETEISEEVIETVLAGALAESALSERLQEFVRTLARAASERRAEIDALLAEVSQNWTLARMASTDRNVLRLAVAELMCFPDTDARVIIDEAVSIARKYGTDDSGRFVNGILDQLARRLRAGEFANGG